MYRSQVAVKCFFHQQLRINFAHRSALRAPLFPATATYILNLFFKFSIVKVCFNTLFALISHLYHR